MSGICGFISNRQTVDINLLERMAASMCYVKEDKTDKWQFDLLGLCRVHHGLINQQTQPIFNEDKNLLIVMAGEVFDYEVEKENLIKKGHKFIFEDNDAEYCLHLYEDKGTECFKELNGSFAIAIYNLKTKELLLVNDRLSTYPVFYYSGEKLIFGTQLSSLMQHSDLARELDIRSFFEFFSFEKILGDKTFYKNVKTLPPASVLIYSENKVESKAYWQRKYTNSNYPEKYYVDKLACGLKKSIERRMRGHYRFGLLLSGGLDSRVIASLSNKKMTAFTVGESADQQQVKVSKMIADTFGYEHVFLKRESDHYANLADKAVEIGSGMSLFVNAHNLGFFPIIEKKCDILLHGYLCDTLFKGWKIPTRTINILGKKISNPFQACSFDRGVILKNSLYSKNPAQLFMPEYAQEFEESIKKSLDNFFAQTEKNGVQESHKEYEYFAFPSALKHIDCLYILHNQACFCERTVLLDNDLLELYLETPVRLRLNGRLFKKVIKKICRKISFIPDANTGLSIMSGGILEWIVLKSKMVLDKISAGKKRKEKPSPQMCNPDSWPNYSELIRHNQRLKQQISDIIEDPQALDPSIFNISRIKEMFIEHMERKNNHTMFLLLLLTFGKWNKKFPRKI
ncbi:MAG: asparagine synthase-related protein [Candidatus Omnitrophota bacterium]